MMRPNENKENKGKGFLTSPFIATVKAKENKGDKLGLTKAIKISELFSITIKHLQEWNLRKNRGRGFQSLSKLKPWPKSIFIRSFLDDGELSDNQGKETKETKRDWPGPGQG